MSTAVEIPEYEFVRPITKIKLRWRPISGGKEMQILAAYRMESNVHLREYERLAKRIIAVAKEPDTEPEPLVKMLGHADLTDWLDIEIDLFRREVSQKELALLAAHGKTQGPSPTAATRDMITRLESMFVDLGAALADLRGQLDAIDGRPGPLT